MGTYQARSISTNGDAERIYLEQLRAVYNQAVDHLNRLTGESYHRAKKELQRQARFYKCISGHDITDRGARRG